MIPCLDTIMAKLLDKTLTKAQRQWYKYTLWGYQVDPDTYDQTFYAGQVHLSGYSKEDILELCDDNNLTVKECYRYDGYATPSLYFVIIK